MVAAKPLLHGLRRRINYRWLSLVLGIVTFLTFAVSRLLLDVWEVSTGDVPAYVLLGVVLTVVVSAFFASLQDGTVESGLLLALGPVAGLALYLFGYRLVLPASTDSPTWLIFLVFAAGFVGLDVAAFGAGSLFRRYGRGGSPS